MAQVNTVVYKVDPLNPDDQIIEKCAQIIKKGGLVAFPTETVYGLGANAFDLRATLKVFEVKARPKTNPLIVHISHLDQLYDLTPNISSTAEILINKFWPGPLTLLFPRSEIISDIITANSLNVAVRMPDHPVSKMFINACGVPLVAPSANRSGRPSPVCAQDVLDDLGGKIQAVLDGGVSNIGVESTVLDVSVNPPVILRPGAVTSEQIKAVLGTKLNFDITLAPRPVVSEDKHYVPDADLYLATGNLKQQRHKIMFQALKLLSSQAKVSVLASQENFESYNFLKRMAKTSIRMFNLGSKDNLPVVASNLYSSMRCSERFGAKVILSETFDMQGIGVAINDTLQNASQGKLLPEFEKVSVDPFKITMVCTGNTCRSPMAEGILRKLWKKAGEPYPIKIDSGGVGAISGLLASHGAVESMKRMGGDISSHSSAPVTREGIAETDIAITMTRSHKQVLLQMYPEFAHKVFTLSEISTKTDGDVIDPFGKSQEEYDKTANLLKCLLKDLVRQLLGQKIV